MRHPSTFLLRQPFVACLAALCSSLPTHAIRLSLFPPLCRLQRPDKLPPENSPSSQVPVQSWPSCLLSILQRLLHPSIRRPSFSKLKRRQTYDFDRHKQANLLVQREDWLAWSYRRIARRLPCKSQREPYIRRDTSTDLSARLSCRLQTLPILSHRQTIAGHRPLECSSKPPRTASTRRPTPTNTSININSPPTWPRILPCPCSSSTCRLRSTTSMLLKDSRSHPSTLRPALQITSLQPHPELAGLHICLRASGSSCERRGRHFIFQQFCGLPMHPEGRPNHLH